MQASYKPNTKQLNNIKSQTSNTQSQRSQTKTTQNKHQYKTNYTTVNNKPHKTIIATPKQPNKELIKITIQNTNQINKEPNTKSNTNIITTLLNK